MKLSQEPRHTINYPGGKMLLSKEGHMNKRMSANQMPFRNISKQAVDKFDAAADYIGVSRSELLRQLIFHPKFEVIIEELHAARIADRKKTFEDYKKKHK